MSKNLPVPLGSHRRLRPGKTDQPEVIVIDAPRAPQRAQAHPLARLAIGLAPDILRAVERSLAQRGESQPAPLRTESRARASGFQLTEAEYDLRVPFVRKVIVRNVSAWAADLPVLVTPDEPTTRRGGLRVASAVGAGALALTALGLLANRVGGLPGRSGRR